MTNGVGLRADFSGAIRKTETLKNLPKAHKWIATNWSSETLKELIRSAADRQISIRLYHAKKGGMMHRNIGQLIAAGDDKWTIAIGTGIAGRQSVPYAKIQDVGGTTHPTVTPRMRRWAWAMYAQWGEERYKWLALTKKSKLTVNIWPSKWFTSIIEAREPILSARMQKAEVLKLAEMRAGSSAGKLAK